MKRIPKVILLVPANQEYNRGVLRGIMKYVQINGPWLFLEEPPEYLQTLNLRQRLAFMRRWQADGMIALQSRGAEIKALHLPTVILAGIHHLPANCCQVLGDNERIGRMAADYLLGLGLREFAYCGLAGMEWAAVRCAGFRARLGQDGFIPHVYRPASRHPAASWYTEERPLRNWLLALPKPIGLMACNDDRARILSEICHRCQIRVPDDIAIIGVDNDEHVCHRTTPPLSSVALAAERGGYEAAALLNSLLAGKHPTKRRILIRPTHVVTRQSTDLIATHDPHLTRAVRYIRENSHRGIQVPDVAKAAGLSRRVLQDRFQQSIGRTVLSEIHRMRIRHICRMLTETNLPVAEIAATLGYEADAHIARFFSRQTGMTPLEYRRKHRLP